MERDYRHSDQQTSRQKQRLLYNAAFCNCNVGNSYFTALEELDRGVQYVHCVMHKCIMVKLGGNEKHIGY